MKRNDIIIEAEELLMKLDDPNLRIYDATIQFFSGASDIPAYDAYLQGHIPNAAFFDHDNFADTNSEYRYTLLPENELKTQIGNIGISADSEVILYTTTMLSNATRAWWLLRYAGHNNVRILNGGLAAWQKAGGQIEQTVNQYSPAKFEGETRSHMFASKEEVEAAMEDDAICTVYTLSGQMYGGVHIPNSAFLPFNELMEEMSALILDDQLAVRLQEEAQHERVITYCGGGIAATLNAVAHLIAGNENVAVYDGSLSEWIGEGFPTAKREEV